MSDWQPIETAPRDGKPILLFYPEGGWDEDKEEPLQMQAVMQWEDNGATGYWVGYYSGTSPHGEPTHWMALPNPPRRV